jgi:acyl-CoA synthetase (NDP forming)
VTSFGFGNPARSLGGRPRSHDRPIIAVKSGRSIVGTRAASSHSAALASPDIGIDAASAQTDVARDAEPAALCTNARVMRDR